MSEHDPRYPIGRFQLEGEITQERRAGWIAEIEALPSRMRDAVAGLSDEQLDTPYRPDGWTVRQVVHHVPDSHMHAYIRFKLALTENEPTIKPYSEGDWVQLPDTRLTPPDVSLALLRALHQRWAVLLRSMKPEQFGRTFMHPEHGRVFKLDDILPLYAWHGNHHTAHITALREREGW
jgi:uncharacterized damage-inducible protein DinB